MGQGIELSLLIRYMFWTPEISDQSKSVKQIRNQNRSFNCDLERIFLGAYTPHECTFQSSSCIVLSPGCLAEIDYNLL